MKNLLALTALFGLFGVTVTGCGGKEPAVIESATEADTGMTTTQEQSYEESMKSGAYGSSTRPPGN